MISHLLTSRISVLDVGRVELGGDGSQRTVLDLAERLGARYVTAGADVDGSEPAELEDRWTSLLTESENYQVLPLLVPVPGTAIATAAVCGDSASRIMPLRMNWMVSMSVSPPSTRPAAACRAGPGAAPAGAG